MADFMGRKRPRPNYSAPPGYIDPPSFETPGDFGPAAWQTAQIPSFDMPQERQLPASGLGMGADGTMPTVKLKGLPFRCDIEQIRDFLGVELVDVVFLKQDGRFSGDAIVVLPGLPQCNIALEKHRNYMGKRYVEVVPALREEYYHSVVDQVMESNFPEQANIPGYHPGDGFPSEAPNSFNGGEALGGGAVGPPGVVGGPMQAAPFAGPGAQSGARLPPAAILKLRGLPYRASREEIAAWFNQSGLLQVQLSPVNVHMVKEYDGRASGDAFVEFSSAIEAERGMGKHKAMMGQRYINIYRSSLAEASLATGVQYQ